MVSTDLVVPFFRLRLLTSHCHSLPSGPGFGSFAGAGGQVALLVAAKAPAGFRLRAL